MADIKTRDPGCDDDRGDACARGKRGKRGHDGLTGPTGPTGPAGSPSFPPIIAAANVNSEGTFIEQTGFSASSQPAVGEYVLTITNPPPLVPGVNGLLVFITLAGSVGGQASFLFDAINQVHVYTFDAAGNPADRIFSISILSLA